MTEPDIWTIRPPRLRLRPGEICAESVFIGRTHLLTAWALTAESPRSAHTAVEACARMFKREFAYDFVQYSALEFYDPKETRAFLWTTRSEDREGYRALGACCLRWRVYTNLPAPCWAMQWVWLHPYARHKGALTALWPTLIVQCAPLLVEPPLSLAMQGFLRHKGTIAWMTTAGTPVQLYGPSDEVAQEVAYA